MSNQTSQNLSVVGEGFSPGLRIRLGAPVDREWPLAVLDVRHGYLRLPALELPESDVQFVVEVRLVSPEGRTSNAVPLTVVNDAGFPDLVALAALEGGRRWVALSPTTDALFAVDVARRSVTRVATGDGPAALATWRDGDGEKWLAVVYAFSPELRLFRAGDLSAQPRPFAAPAFATALVVSPEGVAYVAEHAEDTVTAIDLVGGGRTLWRTKVGPNPRALALGAEVLAVGSAQTGEVELLSRKTGLRSAGVSPGPGTPIIGGHTARLGPYAMGGKAPRFLLFFPPLKAFFYSSLGPNIGPNPERMEVSPNSGVAVLNGEGTRVARHLGFGAGVTEGLVGDARSGLLYAADIGVGKVRVIDARRLAQSDASAGRALLQEVAVFPPEDFPLVRERGDFGVSGRAGLEVHSGPKALALSDDGRTLGVLNRFTGTLALVDVGAAAKGQAKVRDQLAVTPVLGQPARRLGQVLYHADLGRTGMSCDACHLEGHTGGVFFEKTRPLRIYRSSTLRAARETPPYFTPATTTSMAHTSRLVGDRNRFHNPDLTPSEVEAITVYASAFAPLPNPFVGTDGAPVQELELPDGARGRPREGLKLFEARCAACHPPPHFSLDQDPATRGRHLDVGTPRGLPLRIELQDLFFKGVGTPSLLGAWDVFPMLTSGAAGFGVEGNARLKVSSRFPLREVLERYSGPAHGNAQALSPDQRNDLLAYVMSL